MDGLSRDQEAEALGKLKQELIAAYHVLDLAGQGTGIAGHLTARLPGTRRFWSHPFGVGFDEMSLEDLIEADFSLETVTGEGRVNPTLHIHTQVYEVRPDVNCIVHTHGKHVTALTARGARLEPAVQALAYYHDDLAHFDEYDGIVLGLSEGDAIAGALGQKRALLLKNHGLLVTEPSIGEAAIGAIILEVAAEIQLLASGGGAELSLMPEESQAQAHGFLRDPSLVRLRWLHLWRRAHRARPGKVPPAPPA